MITEDEDTGDQVVPLAVGVQAAEQGRRETLSPTPQNTQSIRSVIELTVNYLEPSDQCLTDQLQVQIYIAFQVQNRDLTCRYRLTSMRHTIMYFLKLKDKCIE